MIRLTITTVLLVLTGSFLLLGSTVLAQLDYEAADSVYQDRDTLAPAYDLPIPTVHLNSGAVAFQTSLFPEFYKTNSVRRDLRWVDEHDSLLIDFWQREGANTLLLLTRLSGLDWVEDQFDLYLLRYYPSFGGSDPLVIPVGGKRRGVLALAAPEGAVQELNLIYQLAHRMLAQAERSNDPFYRAVATHPLMQPSPYRRDNMAMLLALVTAQQVMGLDSTFDAYQSAFWKDQTPGRTIFEQYLLSEWILTEERPLSQWIIEEPPGSKLVAATRTPRRSASTTTIHNRTYVEGLPLKGELGFSVRLGDNNRLTIDKIDPARLAFACGLREGDQIRSVDGKRLRSQKQMIEYMLDGLDAGGATLNITREGQSETILLQPMDLFLDEDDYYYFDGMPDTMYFEQVPYDTLIDSTGIDSTLTPNQN